MTSATLVALADALVALLNGPPAPFSQPFTAVRAYAPTLHPEDDDGPDPLAALAVYVIPAALEMVTAARGSDEYTYRVDVAVFQRLPEGPLADADVAAFCDPLMALVEQIADLSRSFAAIPPLPERFTGLTNAPVFDGERLRADRLFAGLVTLSFKGVRARG